MRVIVLSERLYPLGAQNAKIAYTVCKEMVKLGHSVISVSFGGSHETTETIDGIVVHRLKDRGLSRFELTGKRNLKLNLIHKTIPVILRNLRRFLLLFRVNAYPNVEPSRTRSLVEKSSLILESQEIDCVLAIFRPFSCVKAASALKQLHPRVLCGAYYLDLLLGQPLPINNKYTNRLFHKLAVRGERRAFESLDFVILPIAGEKVYAIPEYSHLRSKFFYSEFPSLFVDEKVSMTVNPTYELRDRIDLVYAGVLDKEYRSPEYLLQLLSHTGRILGKPIHLCFYGRSNCNDIIERYAHQEWLVARHNGTINPHAVVDQYVSADCLVNIGNAIEGMVPSKLFELFGTCKPLLHIAKAKYDSSVNYVEKYPLGITLHEWETMTGEAQRLARFLRHSIGKKVEINTVQTIYYQNSPEYVACDVLSKMTSLKSLQ